MKHLPWLLLAAVLVYPLLAQGTVGSVSLLRQPLKIFGQPAASDWIDIESGTLGGQPTQFVVPPGQVLTLQYKHVRANSGGGMQGNVAIDGSYVAYIGLSPGELHPLHDSTPAPWTSGEIAREGQVVTLTRTGGTAPQEFTFIIRGWLEEVR